MFFRLQQNKGQLAEIHVSMGITYIVLWGGEGLKISPFQKHTKRQVFQLILVALFDPKSTTELNGKIACISHSNVYLRI